VRECAEDLAKAVEARQGPQSRIAKVEQILESAITEHEALMSLREKDVVELENLAAERREAVTLAHAVKEELRQGIDISIGKPFLLP
jgi:hypothetical protein